jgi:hypothetical protein
MGCVVARRQWGGAGGVAREGEQPERWDMVAGAAMKKMRSNL